MKDFWLSCGHHLLDRNERGWLRATDEFMKVYLARPELTPPPEACIVERRLHAALLSEPWRPVAPGEIDAIADADVRENWRFMIVFREHLAVHRTLEATYAALVREAVALPPIFLDQLAHLILRNALDQCDDAYMLRAAELFFRPQRVTAHNGSLLAADKEQIDAHGPAVSPLAAMFGLPASPEIEVLSDTNAATYWDRSDRYDLALDLTPGLRGIVALGVVIARWLKHFLDIEVAVEPLNELQNVTFTWYIGLDASGTRIGDALWNATEIDAAEREQIIGLFRLTFCDPDTVIDQLGGEPVYLILAITPDKILRMKPQNLLAGLPVLHPETVT